MDSYRFRNVLSFVLFSCGLVLTQEVIYKRLDSTVRLVCPITTSRSITWFGPLNFQIYAVGKDVSQEVSTQVDIKETATENKSVLVIHRFTKDKSGKFRCSDTYNKTEFTVIIKRNPSDLIIAKAIGQSITAVQGKVLDLECRVTSGQPGGNITWSTDGVIVARNGPSLVCYRLTPKRSDNGKLFKCEAFNSEGEGTMESSVLLKVFYIPEITFSPNQMLTVKEGAEAHLTCINDGNDQNATTVWRRQSSNTVITQNDKLDFKSINRSDAGFYTCRVETHIGVFENNANIVVQYAPTLDIQYYSKERKLKCIPSGVPDRYMFKDWEHTTEYNDHIRFLSISKEGNTATLTFPTNVIGNNHHRKRGIYICRASNNISSTGGIFVMRKYNLELNGKPYFVSSTENTQYGIYLQTADIEIKFVSVPGFNRFNVNKNGTKFEDYTKIVHKNMKLTDNIYGEKVSVKGSIIALQIKIDSLDDFTSYEVVVENAIGYSSKTINIVSASAPFMPKILQTSSKQSQIYVLWKPGFDGGYHQWFIVEYTEIEDLYWSNQTVNSSNSAVIGELQPATKYRIRIFARNMIDDSNSTEEIVVKTADNTDKRVSETNSSAIVSLFAVLLCLLIAAAYFSRGKLQQFINTRFTNQANSRAIGNDLDALQNDLHTNSECAAEIPVYSSIDKRHNLRLHQTPAYTVDQKGITNPLKSVHKNRETGKEGYRVNKLGSMKCASGIEEGKKESRELNYVEVFFDQKQVYPFTIHGLDDKTNYVEIDFTQSADPLPDSDTDSESEK